MTSREPVEVVKSGWIQKRGEHIRTWRPRYFVLRTDGSLRGFKSDSPKAEQCNNFTVRGCQIMSIKGPRPFTFIIRGLQYRTNIERMFSLDSEEERSSWMNAIQNVSNNLSEAELRAEQSLDTDVEMGLIAVDELLNEKFSVRGETNTKTNGRRKITFENFEFLKVLGKGTFGKVILCREKITGKLYAIKILKKENIIQRDEIKHIMAENRVLRHSNHPFLISLKYAFQTSDRLCFVMPYVNGGDLYFHLKQEKKFSEERTRFYAAEIVCAVGYLHSHGVIYRDLKLENLLLDREGHIKVADFGLCKEDITYGGTTNTFCGTPEYIAPEVIEDNDYGKAVDWWACGVVMYEMMLGHLPFFNRNRDALCELIVGEKVRFRLSLSGEAQNLLSRLMDKSPSHRIGGGPDDYREIQRHSFFASINWSDLLERKVPPPFKPCVTSETDTKYFDSEFTGESVELTPPDEAARHLQSIIEERRFSQFSYQDLSSTLDASTSYMDGCHFGLNKYKPLPKQN